MKTKIACTVAGLVAVTLLLGARPLAFVEKTAPPKSDPEVPLHLHCVVSIESEAWMANLPYHAPGPASGFLPNFTVEGKLLYLGEDWVVIEQGTYENWISRDKVLNIRASR